MKTKLLLAIAVVFTIIPFFYSHAEKKTDNSYRAEQLQEPEIGEDPCVFMTVMGEQSSEGFAETKTTKEALMTIQQGEQWLVKAQNNDGGWGAGGSQREMDPHKVDSDPATTAMSAMALYRSGYNAETGKYSNTLKKALNYLLKEIETNKSGEYITKVRNTQIQRKLGQHIDAIMTLQFLNQVLPTINDAELAIRVQDAIQICVNKVEKSIDNTGKVNGSGWAGVLQSSFAGAGLEMAAKNKNIKVDETKLQQTREYQKGNFNTDNDAVNTAEGAGIILYSVSSSVRNSAAESREAVEIMEKAKKEGVIEKDAELNVENLQKAGLSAEKAKNYDVAYKVYESAKVKAMRDDVLSGFGSNGGEEFISFLQTGESMVVNKDNAWTKWYDNISGRLIKIQNNDGSWNGHHCITSPVFCTATCLLILTIENDIAMLQNDF